MSRLFNIHRLVAGIALLISPLVFAQDGIVVITHTDTPVETLTRKQIKNVYLGGPLSFDSTPLMVSSPSALRQQFNTKVIGLSESRLRSFMAQMRFSGRKLAIEEVDNELQVIERVTQRPGVIGYVSADVELPDKVRVIYTTAN